MIVYEITGDEKHPVYQFLEIENGNRHYSFLRSAVLASIDIGRPFLSTQIIKALNFHAIACLHTNPGEFRPCPVTVGDGDVVTYEPPQHYRVQALMDDFVNTVNRYWSELEPVALATYALWRLNHIHPFINGNGRTARAVCYFVLCVRTNAWLPGSVILPELIRQNRNEYIEALREVDASLIAGALNISALHAFLGRLLAQQLQTASQSQAPVPPSA